MARQIALLRGVNLGPTRRVAMGDLRALLADAGFADVQTYLQSGNVVLSSPKAPERLARDLERRIAGGLGVETEVIVRTRDELAAVVAGDPLRGVATNPKRYQVSFLSAALDPEVARAVQTAEIAPEQVVVRDRELYAWHPGGIQRSKLARLLTPARLGVTSTARNWTTVTKLLELAGG